MPLNDQARWNARYRLPDRRWGAEPRAFFVETMHLLPPGAKVMDLAMGLGANARPILENGRAAFGVDIASEAVFRAKRQNPALNAYIADLTQLWLPDAYFDGALLFYYLQRDLWRDARRFLKPGGYLWLETLLNAHLEFRPETNPEHLVQPGEAREAFRDWTIIKYDELCETSSSGRSKAIVRMLARND